MTFHCGLNIVYNILINRALVTINMTYMKAAFGYSKFSTVTG